MSRIRQIRRTEYYSHEDLLMRYITVTIAVVLLVLIGIFSLQNLPTVNVSILFWTFSISHSLLILGTYFLGMLTGWGLIDLMKMVFRKKGA